MKLLLPPRCQQRLLLYLHAASQRMRTFLYSLPRDYICHHYVLIIPCRPVAAPDALILSFVTVSLTVLVSVTGFFFTTTSSLTNGSLVTSTSSLFNGTLISVFDFTGPSGDEEESLGGLL